MREVTVPVTALLSLTAIFRSRVALLADHAAEEARMKDRRRKRVLSEIAPN
jgi:hypothetical protein